MTDAPSSSPTDLKVLVFATQQKIIEQLLSRLNRNLISTYQPSYSPALFMNPLVHDSYDLLLVDYDDLAGDAHDLPGNLCSSGIQTPVIFLSDHITMPQAVTLMRQGANGIASKSDPDTFLQIVEEELQRSAIRRSSVEQSPSEQIETIKRASEELNRLVLSNISDAVFITNPEGQFTFICPNVSTIFGYSREEVAAMGTIHKILGMLPVDQNLLEESGEIANIEHIATDQSGTSHDLLVTVKQVAIGEGTTLYTCRDVTARKKIEKALKASEEKFRSLINGSDAVISMVDAQGRHLYLNNIGAAPFGLTEETAVGITLHDLFPPQQADMLLAQVRNVIEQKQGIVLTPQMIPVAVDTRWYRISIQPLNDHNGDTTAAMIFAIDITDTIQSQRLILAQNAILMQSHDLIALGGQDGKIEFINPSGAKMIGADDPSEIIGTDAHDLHLPEDLEKLVGEYLPRAIEYGYWRGEFRLKTRSGQIIDVDQTLFPIHDAQGNILHIATIMIDISDHKRAEEWIRESEAKYRLLAEHMADVIWILDVDTLSFTYTSPSIQLLSGFTPDEMLRKSLNEVITQGSLDKVYERLSAQIQAFAAGEEASPTRHEVEQLRKDGSTIWTEVVTTLIQTETGTVQILGVSRDISKRRQAELALRKSEGRYRQMFENVSLPKMILDPQTGLILDANQAAVDFYGYSSQELKTMNITQIDVAEPQTIFAKMEGVLQGDVRYCSFAQRAADNSIRDTEAYPTLLEIDGENVLYCIYIDVTERNQARKALQEANILLEQRVIERTAELERTKDRLEAIFEHSGDGILLINLTEGILQANHAFQETFATTDYAGSKLSQFFQPIDGSDLDPLTAHAAANHSTIRIEARAVQANGESAIFEISIAPVNRSDKAVQNLVCIIRDITERKNMEMRLRQSEERYRTTVDAMSEGLIVMAGDASIQFYNAAAERILGLTHDEIIGTQINPAWHTIREDGSLLPPNQRPGYLASQTGESQSNVVMGVHNSDGTIAWILVNSEPLQDPDGNVYAIISTFTDITRLKHTEEELNEKHRQELEMQRYLIDLHEITLILTRTRDMDEFYRLTVEQGLTRFGFERMGLMLFTEDGSVQGTYGTDPSGTICAEHELRLKPDDLTGILRKTLDRKHRFAFEDPAQLYFDKRYLRTGQNAVATLWNGEALGWLAIDNAVTGNPIRSVQMEILALYALTVGSLLARKRAESEALSLSQRLKLATQAGKVGIWDWDLETNAVVWNENMYQIYGIDPDTDMSAFERGRKYIHPEDLEEFATQISSAIQAGDLFESEYRIIRPDESIRHIDTNAMILRGDDGKAQRMIAVNLDVTSTKRAEQMLLQALEKEKEVGELKSRFVSMASHEFRTPLAVILATTETLLTYRSRMDESQIDLRLNKIRGQVHHMKDIMEDVLQLARIQAKRLEYKPAQAGMDTLCQDIVEEFENQNEHQGRIIYRCHTKPVIGIFDTRLIRQVITNLTHNALKYSPVEKLVILNLEQDQDAITLHIKDEGIGIPADDLEHLFEPFHRARNVGSISGTGLGLSIAKQAVELHGGTLTVHSSEGNGTTFTIMIPKFPAVADSHQAHPVSDETTP